MSTKIFDCITFYNANFLFKTRFNILKDVVDYFVVCEADKDHVGNSKKYNFDEDFYNKNMKKYPNLGIFFSTFFDYQNLGPFFFDFFDFFPNFVPDLGDQF